MSEFHYHIHNSSYVFAHHAMHAKMGASGSHSAHLFDSEMLRRPLYWDMRSVRLYV
jgi:hypothetical protein